MKKSIGKTIILQKSIGKRFKGIGKRIYRFFEKSSGKKIITKKNYFEKKDCKIIILQKSSGKRIFSKK